MIRLIEQALKSQITGLNFIEKYGALARPLTVKVATSQPDRFRSAVVPVSCDVSHEDCFEGGKYKELIPDESYMSLAYLEQQNGARVTSARQLLNGEEDLRLVVWLNYKKLGIADCAGTTRFALAIAKAIRGHREFSVDGVDGTLHVINMRFVEDDPKAVFGKYDYGDKEKFFFWPFGFIAIDFTAKVSVNPNCLTDITLGTEIECVTEY